MYQKSGAPRAFTKEQPWVIRVSIRGKIYLYFSVFGGDLYETCSEISQKKIQRLQLYEKYRNIVSSLAEKSPPNFAGVNLKIQNGEHLGFPYFKRIVYFQLTTTVAQRLHSPGTVEACYRIQTLCVNTVVSDFCITPESANLFTPNC